MDTVTARSPASLVALAVATWRRPERYWTSLGVLVAGALVVTIALTGHAAVAQSGSGLVHRVADAAHLVAAAVWLGALPPLLLLLRDGRLGLLGTLAAHRDRDVFLGERLVVVGAPDADDPHHHHDEGAS